MDYDRIKYAAYCLYIDNNIYRLPFNCFTLLKNMNYEIKKYSALSDVKYNACMTLSQDACTIENTICYNDNMPSRRIRFSLMHEVGHIILGTDLEAEANCFASNVLAPSIAVHYSKLKNIRELSNLFDISLECAEYAYENYERWYYSVKKYGMSDVDKKMYHHFFDSDLKQFIFKKFECVYCDTTIVNTSKPFCYKCDKKPSSNFSILDGPNMDLVMAENHWLYGFD